MGDGGDGGEGPTARDSERAGRPVAVRLAGRLARALGRSAEPGPTADAATAGDDLAGTGAPPASDWSACYAPHSTMYFDQRGRVRACCQNSGTLLGDVGTASIREIWDSASADRLRSALEADDYGEGCEFCAWQVREGNDDIVFARGYDRLRPADRRPSWPRRMEFALTNTCNLQCTMCNGEWSSTIRSRREGLPPLPRAYDEAFFAELADFLPHLDSAQFVGGEPLLGTEPLRVMEMLTQLPEPPRVSLITNGTTCTARVERIITTLRPDIIVSIDGATTETYDAVRVGAHLPDVLANLDRFVALLGPGKVSITTCLMTTNWHEFHLVLGLAEERDLQVGVNVVRNPFALSPYHLGADRLAEVVDTMTATAVSLTGPRLAAWDAHVAALDHRLQVLRRGEAVEVDDFEVPGTPAASSRWPWLPFPESPTDAEPATLPASVGPELRFSLDRDGRVTVDPPIGPDLDLDLDLDLGLDLDLLDGSSVAHLTEVLATVFGDPTSWPTAPRRRPQDDDRHWTVMPATETTAAHELLWIARRDRAGDLIGASMLLRPQTRPIGSAWT